MHMKTSAREMKLKQRIKELEYLLREKEKELKHQKKILEEERISIEILKKIPAHLHSTTRMKYEAILNNSSMFEVRKMCRVLGVKSQNYYRWKSRFNKDTIKHIQELRDLKLIKKSFETYNGVYGYRRIKRQLENEGVSLSEYRIRRIMRENGLYPKLHRRYKPIHNGVINGKYCEDIVKQQFCTSKLDDVWVGDITYIKTMTGWVYLAVVIDLFNREVIGYAISKKSDTELTKQALTDAIGKRGIHKGLIFHSDRGCQYASKGFQNLLEYYGITPSMSRPGCPYDNSCSESFFATLKKERIYRRKYSSLADIKQDLFQYIELFYNRKRMHSLLGYVSPVSYRGKFGF